VEELVQQGAFLVRLWTEVILKTFKEFIKLEMSAFEGMSIYSNKAVDSIRTVI